MEPVAQNFRNDRAPAPNYGNVSLADLVEEVEQLRKGGQEEAAILKVKAWIIHHPLNERAFFLLGELYQERNEIGNALVVFERAMELKELSAAYEPSEGLSRLQDLEHFSLHAERTIELDGFRFSRVKLEKRGRGVYLTARSLDGKGFLTVELVQDPFNRQSLNGETEMLKALNFAGCLSAPRLYAFGQVPGAELERAAPWEGERGPEVVPAQGYPYHIREYLSGQKGYTLADITLTLLEHKAAGVFPGEVEPRHIRFDKETGILRLVHYQNGCLLDGETTRLGNRAYLEWCENWIGTQNLKGETPSVIHGLELPRAKSLLWKNFREDAFQLGTSGCFQRYANILHQSGRFYGLRNHRAVLDGKLSFGILETALCEIDFVEEEAVLIAGSPPVNLGLFLCEAGCRVRITHSHPQVITATRMAAHLLGYEIREEDRRVLKRHPDGRFESAFLQMDYGGELDPDAMLREVAPVIARRIFLHWLPDEKAKKGFAKGSEAGGDRIEEKVTIFAEQLPDFRFSQIHLSVEDAGVLIEFEKET